MGASEGHHRAPRGLASRVRPGDELAARLAGIDALTDVVTYR
jgi:hypothetical protein